MKLNLSKLKEVLIIEDEFCDDIGREINEWVRNNIGDGDVSIREWLDKFGEYWSKWSDDYGDSGIIKDILVEDYELNEEEVDEVMMMYWGVDEEEYKREYK